MSSKGDKQSKQDTKPRVDSDAVRELAQLLKETGLTEIEIEHNGARIRVSRGGGAAAPVPVSAAAPAPAAAATHSSGPPAGAVLSPMVGTVYAAPEPGNFNQFASRFQTTYNYKPPRIAILATGDEIVPIDQEPGKAQIRNSNSLMLTALLRRLGCEVWFFLGIWRKFDSDTLPLQTETTKPRLAPGDTDNYLAGGGVLPSVYAGP